MVRITTGSQALDELLGGNLCSISLSIIINKFALTKLGFVSVKRNT